jgi:hypothetical protein
MCARRLFALVILLALAGCGGGGGGGGGGPGFSVSPGSLTFNGTTGGSTPPPQTITVTVFGGTVYIGAFYGGSAISNATFSITGPTTAAITVYPSSPGNLGGGTHSGTITIVGCNDQNCNSQVSGSPTDVSVTYQVSGITTTPNSVALASAVSTPSAPVSLNLSSTAGGSWSSSISYSGATTGWLTLSPANGTTLPASIDFTGGAIATPGTYQATVTFTNGSLSRNVPVTYVVNRALSPSPTSLTYTIGNAPTAGDLTRSLSAGAYSGVTWTASANVAWLSLSPTSGGSGGTVTASLVQAQLNAMNNGVYNGTITLTPSVGAVETVPVALTIARTQVNFVAPYVAIAGAPADVIVRGENFNQVTVQNVRFGSTNATAFTVVSNTEIHATHPALTAGSYLVQLQNNLGIERSLATLVAVDAPAYAAGTIDYPNATAKTIQSLVYDAERRALVVAVRYPSAPDSSEILHYPYVSNAWAAATPVGVAKLRDVALSLDGTQWLAVSDFAVSQFNAATLAAGTVTNAPFSSFYYLKNLAVANDGNALVVTGVNGSGYTTAYRYAARNPALVSSSSYYFGNLAASGDGSRIVVGSNGLSPAPEVYYYNASTGTTIDSGIDLNTSAVAFGRTTSRLLLNHTRVYDSNFVLTGNLPATTVTSVLAPNGARAYTFDAGQVHVFDLTAAPVSGIYPEIGTGTALAGAPGNGVKMAISPDGGTLFLAGDARIVLLPTP